MVESVRAVDTVVLIGAGLALPWTLDTKALNQEVAFSTLTTFRNAILASDTVGLSTRLADVDGESGPGRASFAVTAWTAGIREAGGA